MRFVEVMRQLEALLDDPDQEVSADGDLNLCLRGVLAGATK